MELQKVSRVALILIVIISGVMGTQLPNVKFDYDFERFFPKDNPETTFFNAFREQFGGDNDYFLLGLEPGSGIFNSSFLKKVDQLTQSLEEHPDVQLVHSPTNMKALVRDKYSASIIQRPWIHLDQEDRLSEDSIRIYNSDLVGYLFSENRQSVALFVRHNEQLSEDCCASLAKFTRNTVAALALDNAHYAGKCFGQTHFINLIQKETLTFVGMATLLIIVFLWISYRSLWGIYLPMAVVGLSVLWTIGIMTLLGRPLDLISNVIPTILLIIGISDVVHLLTHYLTALQTGQGKIEALKVSIKSVGKATLLTTLTTAIGFLTLTTSSFLSLIDLGIFSTIGLLIAFLLTYTLLPAVLIFHPKLKPSKHSIDSFWNNFLSRCFEWVKMNPKPIIITSMSLLVLGLIGASQIRMNNYILDDLRDSDPQKRDFLFFENYYGGARSFDVQLNIKSDSLDIFKPEILKEIEIVDQYLREEYGVSNLLSPARLIAESNEVYHFGKKTFERVPDKEAEVQRLVRRMKRFKANYDTDRLVSEDKKEARISGLVPDWGSFKIRKKDEAFYAFVASEFPESPIAYKITGAPFLMDLNTQYLAENILQGLIFALGIIALLFAYLFRSVKLVLITLVPNILPLVFVAGVMGFSGIDLKISTSIIFILAFGIAVDDSIHFLSRFRKEWKDKPLEEAIRVSYLHTGKAIIVTSIILAGGFLTLCLSSFWGTFYMGLLIAVTLWVALIADLTILPVLLFFLKEKDRPFKVEEVEDTVEVYVY